MKSVRLGEELEARLRAAATVADVSESEIIRSAVGDRCDAILTERLDARLADVVGAVRSRRGGRARDTGASFTRLLRKWKRSR